MYTKHMLPTNNQASAEGSTLGRRGRNQETLCTGALECKSPFVPILPWRGPSAA